MFLCFCLSWFWFLRTNSLVDYMSFRSLVRMSIFENYLVTMNVLYIATAGTWRGYMYVQNHAGIWGWLVGLSVRQSDSVKHVLEATTYTVPDTLQCSSVYMINTITTQFSAAQSAELCAPGRIFMFNQLQWQQVFPVVDVEVSCTSLSYMFDIVKFCFLRTCLHDEWTQVAQEWLSDWSMPL